ncbi:hypothetical protein [Asticcacaulis sp.]|uniref:hypothetical protein n=1 Tax=Asticcacaulis sp. TaxID=1872648 RepID=UPI002628B91A|nr:hypothetical protein [Asticcacaulis sp.]
MLKWIGRSVFYAAILIGAGLSFYSASEASKVTVRNISSPRAEYTIPYETHGGTVYISVQEDRIVNTLSKAVFAGIFAVIAVGLVVKKVRELR